MDSFSNETGKGCTISIIFIVVICAAIAIGDYHHRKNNNIIKTDVELQKNNDSLKFEVDNLDSIKNAKVIEVKALDNDSTVKLFYQLIK